MRYRLHVVFALSSFGMLHCAQHYAPLASPESSPRHAPLREAQLSPTPEPEHVAPPVSRPRLRDVVTLGNADPEPRYPVASAASRAAQAITNITVINQQAPAYTGYWGGGGFGYRSFGYGSYGGYRSFSGSAAGNYGTGFGAQNGGNGGTSAGAPTQVGGDWPAPRDFGPRQMK